MKKIYTSLLLTLFFFGGNAQQLNSTSFYELYAALHNPATAGSEENTIVGASFKKQWSGMPGSPKTGVIYGQAKLSSSNIGLGGYLYHDVTGATSRTGLQLAYAYRVALAEKKYLSIGLEGRLQQFAFDRAKLQNELGATDPVAAAQANNWKGDAGAGIAFTTPRLQIGAAVSQLLQSKLSLYDPAGPSQSQLSRHYYLHGFYQWAADEETTITPNFLMIYLPNAPTELQTGVRVEHNKLFYYGLTWRMRQAWMLSAGIRLKEKFTVGYSFDIYKAPLSIYEKGASGHELALRYSL